MQSLQLRHTLKYGAIIGGIIFVFSILLNVFNQMYNHFLTSIPVIIFVFGVSLTVRHYRDRYCAGTISFGKAYGTSILTIIVIGLIWSVYTYLLYKFLNTGLLLERMAEAQETYLQIGMSEEWIENSINADTFTPGTVASSTFLSVMFYGSLLALIISAIQRKNRNPLLTNNQDDNN